MIWQSLRLACFVGLICWACAGCATLWAPGDGFPPHAGQPAAPSLSGGAADESPPLADPAGKAKSSPDAAAHTLEGQFAMARLCEHRGDDVQAAQLYEALRKQAPRDVRLEHRLAVLAVKKGDFARAEAYFASARELAAPSAELLCDLGYCRYLQGKLPEAEELLRESLAKEPSRAATINNLALVRGRRGHYDESLALFQRVNTEAEAYANLAYVMAQNGDAAAAEKMYLRSLTLDDKLRAAAEAMLQVADRRQTQAKFAAASREEPTAAAPAASAAAVRPTEASPTADLPHDVPKGASLVNGQSARNY